jgi:hypothetical protein
MRPIVVFLIGIGIGLLLGAWTYGMDVRDNCKMDGKFKLLLTGEITCSTN